MINVMTNDTSNRATKPAVSGWWWILAVVFVLLSWTVSGWLNYCLYESGERGQFGDTFGAVNALFSGLAFATLIYTMLLQRDELKLTHAGMDEQQRQMKAQTATLEKQQFESTYFQMLGLHRATVNAMRSETQTRLGSTITRAGLIRLDDLSTLLDVSCRSEDSTQPSDSERVVRGAVNFFRECEPELGHYLRTLSSIVTFVDRAGIDPDDSRFYIDLLLAQLSVQEQVLMFYFGLTPLGSGLKLMIEKYTLFKHLNVSDLFGDHSHYYLNSAYVLPNGSTTS